jgi:hypothetical protein
VSIVAGNSRRIVAQDALARAEAILYYNRINLASQYWHGGKVGTAELTLDACPADLRQWEWRYLKRLCHADLLTLPHGNGVFDVAYSPDGKRLAATGGNDLTLWDALTGKELLFLSGGSEPGQLTGVAFSPDGKRLAVAGGSISTRRPDGDKGKACNRGFVRILDAATGQELRTLKGHGDIAFGVAFSPDGARLASAGGWGERPAELTSAPSRPPFLQVHRTPAAARPRIVSGSVPLAAVRLAVADVKTATARALASRSHRRKHEHLDFSQGFRVVPGNEHCQGYARAEQPGLVGHGLPSPRPRHSPLPGPGGPGRHTGGSARRLTPSVAGLGRVHRSPARNGGQPHGAAPASPRAGQLVRGGAPPAPGRPATSSACTRRSSAAIASSSFRSTSSMGRSSPRSWPSVGPRPE